MLRRRAAVPGNPSGRITISCPEARKPEILPLLERVAGERVGVASFRTWRHAYRDKLGKMRLIRWAEHRGVSDRYLFLAELEYEEVSPSDLYDEFVADGAPRDLGFPAKMMRPPAEAEVMTWSDFFALTAWVEEQEISAWNSGFLSSGF
ncbi:hypothetical protein ACIQUL_29470 [Streptomyces sp. NPDC090303]|uniref:hypothetical protein n=1 Tax=Streptomyces sp. NPDC090303 TaxID=3365960 RepID=UPI003809EFF8